MLAKIIFFVVTLLAIAFLVLWLSQRNLLYFPHKLEAAEEARLAAELDLLAWLDSSGKQIGWTSPGVGDPVVIFHGNAGNTIRHAYLMERLRDAGVHSPLHILEYPGFGSRDGRPTERSLVQAALDGIDSLGKPATVVGQSLGTGVACAVASRRPELVKGLMLITPFDSMVSVARVHYPWAPISLLLLDRYSSSEALKNYHGPLSVILAEGDTVTTPAAAKKLYDNYSGPKKLWDFPGSGHNEVIWDMNSSEWREAFNFAACSR